MAALNDLFDPRVERRSADRCADRSSLRVAQWQCDQVQLLEISSGGFRASKADQIAAGELITVSIPALGTKSARVKWVDGDVFGAEFTNPADLRLLFLGGPVEPRTTWLERLAA